ncbi:F-box/kelch-repeat protein SKIP11-like [Macadamia integrifolia]|uniref:F-box/kelch-repeat protein SKIP11-like n=1 Tax=Macadamia integrifolia TaxID=60698 RepID=UPI001C4F63DD|nr:F-box/kelch-repeat protein SKIP11-like [Macadamia integrifolia]XP_042514981.1 F-box/kelch-repeat protein SKIP11-like [Macadamia integrifolia]
MLEGQSYLISRALPSSCEQESKWAYMTYHLIEVSNGKRHLEDEGEEALGQRKSSKISDANQREEMTRHLHNLSQPSEDQTHSKRHRGDQSDSNSLTQSNRFLNMHQREVMSQNHDDVYQSTEDQSNSQHHGGDQSDSSSLIQPIGQESSINCLLHTHHRDEMTQIPEDQSHGRRHHGDQSDLNSLIQPIGRDTSINCLLLCSRSDYGSLASLNRSFRSLIRTGELYRLRRMKCIIEHWVYFSCQLLEWEAFDPIRRRWMHLPRMPANECFMCADKESLAVGTELLVFGKEVTSQVIYRYSILTNSWSSGLKMNAPRCLFGSASLGEIAILAGGSDSQGNVLNSAELYNSETGTWETLPSMKKPRKMCSGVFMDGKFYVIGGSNTEPLSCGEEYDLQTGIWREIPGMFPIQSGANGGTAPPLVAVVNNELYAADYAENEVRKYVKDGNSWITIGRLPERAVSMNGWGLAFRACGSQLIVIGGPRALGGGIIELNSWSPNEGPPQWDLLASKHLASFVYNCAVMGC